MSSYEQPNDMLTVIPEDEVRVNEIVVVVELQRIIFADRENG